MPQRTMLEDAKGNIFATKQDGAYTALRVASVDAYDWDSKTKLLLNEEYGPNFNQDAEPSGTPDGIHDGTDTALWTATALSGSWDFASTAQAQTGTKSIDGTGTINNSQAELERSSALDPRSYNSLSGGIYLTFFNPAANEIRLKFRLAGVDVGQEVNLGGVIDASTLNSWQNFNIPLSDFDLTGDVDQLIITTKRQGDKAANFYLDNLQIEEAGSSVFYAEAAPGKIFEIQTVEVLMVDAISTTLSNSSMPALSYDKFLNVNQLNTGITIRRFKNGEAVFSLTARKLGDLLYGNFTITDMVSDGTNTLLKLRMKLDWWAPLDFRTRDRIEVVISDDLSGLIEAKAMIRGRERDYK